MSTIKVPVKPVFRFYEICILSNKFQYSPSLIDGLDHQSEIGLRILGCEWIEMAGAILGLPQAAIATSQILFQRFYSTRSFIRNTVEIIVMGCICLASKIEGAPRRIRDVIEAFHEIKPIRPEPSMILDQTYVEIKSLVIKAYRCILEELDYCVKVMHLDEVIVTWLKVLGHKKHEKIVQMSLNFLNIALRTDAFARHQPETIACACIYMSGRKLNQQISKNSSWYDVFSVTKKDIVDICHRVMEFYCNRENSNEGYLEDVVNKLQKVYLATRNEKCLEVEF